MAKHDDISFTDDEIEEAGLTESELAALNGEDFEPPGTGEDDDDTDSDLDAEDDSGDGDSDDDDSDSDNDDDDGDQEEDDTDDDEDDADDDGDSDGDDDSSDEGDTGDGDGVDSGDDDGEAGEIAAQTTQQQQTYRGPDVNLDEVRAQITDLDKQSIELGEKLDAGDITGKEFQEQNLELMNQKSALQSTITKAEIAEDSAMQQWEREQKAFFDDPAHQIYKGKIAHSALNEAVLEVSREEAFYDATGAQLLAEAHRRVAKEFGIDAPATTETPKPKEDPKPKPSKAQEEMKARASKAKSHKLPKTLGGVPAADDTGSEYAEMDSLDGIEAEMAYESMNETQRERYLKA